ncbi:hypothetical protein AB0C40_08430 [Streptomyces brevispora]|uniref:hypothetical protein n=1 Tax=Streptomyces brevispora TaxID=887462 RepID=UPI00340054F4
MPEMMSGDTGRRPAEDGSGGPNGPGPRDTWGGSRVRGRHVRPGQATVTLKDIAVPAGVTSAPSHA